MLELHDIKKDYGKDDNVVHALKGVSLSFRTSEFVSILGASGCGKTTLLNIVGGLDRYTSGDLVINGRSTRTFKDYDWDAYRNRYVGFVFQSYNLIAHQSVLGNVELALTLSGIPKSERRARAKAALEKVGLSDQLKKRPNQLSGGQMQRVAIARAIVNNPSIILADEPTGALDSVTSVQIMEILKEISKDRLIIMVTHNGSLANQYSTRIINLSDGLVTDDSNPFSPDSQEREQILISEGVDLDSLKVSDKDSLSVPKNLKGEERTAAAERVKKHKAEENERAKKRRAAFKKTSMKIGTAVSLSGRNLLTKKGRTFLVSLAASIGIIGIALVLSISNGFQKYIQTMQADMLSYVPVQITQQFLDLETLLNDGLGSSERPEKFPSGDTLNIAEQNNNFISNLLHLNPISQEYVDYVLSFDSDPEKPKTVAIQQNYAIEPNLVKVVDGKVKKIRTGNYKAGESELLSMFSTSEAGADFTEILENQEFFKQQYDCLSGYYPGEAPLSVAAEGVEQVALVLDQYNQINKSRMDLLGLTPAEGAGDYKYSKFIGQEYVILNNDNYYEKSPSDGIYRQRADLADMDLDAEFDPDKDIRLQFNPNKDIRLRIVGILRINEKAPSSIYGQELVYRNSLTKRMLALNAESELVTAQKAELENRFTGKYIVKLPGVNIVNDNDSGVQFLPGATEDAPPEPMAGKTFAEILSSQMTQSGVSLDAIFGDIFAVYKDDPGFTPFSLMQFLEDASGLGPLTGMSNDELFGLMFQHNQDFFEAEFGAGWLDRVLEILDNPSFENPMTPVFRNYIAMLETAYLHIASNSLNVCAGTETPVSLSIFPLDFQQKDALIKYLDDWNKNKPDYEKVHYSDTLSILGNTMSNLVNIIGYVLTAFAAVSLVVSSIMIAIITYVSVIERTKEIGVLRSIGARKKDISRVFNAETIIIGLIAGLLGVFIAFLLTIPINLIIGAVVRNSGASVAIGNLAVLNPLHALILVIVSTVLTFISGFIPSRMAAKKDPVVALRTE
jgi:putative ABC transport system permease protein